MRYLFVFLLIILKSVAIAQTETEKQPNCEDVVGLPTSDLFVVSNVPKNYSGKMYKCKWGVVERIINFKDGQLNGLCMRWHDNGQLMYREIYKDGALDGISKYWYKNGQLEMELLRHEGLPAGLTDNSYEKYWNENGQLIYMTECEKAYDYVYKEWYDNGQLKSESNHKNGEVISTKCFDENGNLKECDWGRGAEDE